MTTFQYICISKRGLLCHDSSNNHFVILSYIIIKVDDKRWEHREKINLVDNEKNDKELHKEVQEILEKRDSLTTNEAEAKIDPELRPKSLFLCQPPAKLTTAF